MRLTIQIWRWKISKDVFTLCWSLVKGRWRTRIEPAGTPFLFRYNHTFEGQQIRALKKQGASSSKPPIKEVRTADEDADQEEEEVYNEHVQMLRALKERATSSRPPIQEVRTADEDADQEEEEEGHHEHVQMLSPQPRTSGRSSHHETGTSTHHSDPEQIFSFTWDQRQSFLQEVGNYAAQRAKEEFDAQKKAWTEEVGSYVATKVKEELEYQRLYIVQELGDYVLRQLGDIFPGYSDYMAHRSQRADEDFANWNLTMSRPIPENEMATQDDPNWMQTIPNRGSLWRTGQERQWPTESSPLSRKTPNLPCNQTKEANGGIEKSFQAE